MKVPPKTAAPLTVGALITEGAQRLARARLYHGHGLADARDEAAALVLHVLKLPLGAIPLSRVMPAAAAAHARVLLDRRVRERKPLPYLTGEAWLAGYRFVVDERVLVPRSYIAELLTDEQSLLPAADSVGTALDLCTGSGCLAVLAAKHYRGAQVDASDISADALAVAKRNVARYRLGRRIALIQSDYFAALRGRRYDLILTNPPYVTARVMRGLPAEYRHEPALALAAGADGLDAVRVILHHAAPHLRPGGVLLVECGHARPAVERAWPRLPFLWLDTSGGDDCVFALTSEELQAQLPPSRPRASGVKKG